jgi:hypothetical protein
MSKDQSKDKESEGLQRNAINGVLFIKNLYTFLRVCLHFLVNIKSSKNRVTYLSNKI